MAPHKPRKSAPVEYTTDEEGVIVYVVEDELCVCVCGIKSKLCEKRCFFKKRSVISRRKQKSAFDQVSEFDRGRIVAYRDCGLSFREIGSRVGRN
ncbi:hypothetical protein TNCV_795481 [Trichonephila clavipes]|nr:hypothetical protein TNCV_795481 [Trichonephila clavipes]